MLMDRLACTSALQQSPQLEQELRRRGCKEGLQVSLRARLLRSGLQLTLHRSIPAINLDAGTVSALYYKAVRNYDLPLRDILVSPQQDAKLTVAEFDVRWDTFPMPPCLARPDSTQLAARRHGLCKGFYRRPEP